MSDPKRFFERMLGKADVAATTAVTKVIEEWAFPWYEAVTGKAPADWKMRQRISDKIESEISHTDWRSKATGHVFLVHRVFTQNLNDEGTHDVFVSLSHRDGQGCNHKYTLMDFLCLFEPNKLLTSDDYDS